MKIFVFQLEPGPQGTTTKMQVCGASSSAKAGANHCPEHSHFLPVAPDYLPDRDFVPSPPFHLRRL